MTTLIGGEMLHWSDAAPAGGPALRPLLHAAAGDILVAGPHAAGLLDALPPGRVTVLVRGAADAQALAGRPGVTVWCGSIEKVAAVPAYDTVVALDGLDRLRSAEADDAPWDDTLAHLVALLRPGGRLLLGVENLFGLHRLVAVPPALTDAQWVVPSEHDTARPAGPAALRARLAAAGLTAVRDYAAYPAAAGPAALLGPEILAAAPLAGFVGAALASACADLPGALADPARLAAAALRHGLAADLAPGWVVLAQRPGGPGAGGGFELPDVPGGFDAPDAVVGAREIRLADDDLPRGRTLAALLLAACHRRDLPAVRELLGRWLDGPAAGVPADRVVVDGDGRFTGLAPAGPPLVALRHFAGLVIRAGHAELWPAPADEAELTALLAGMAGREVDPADVPPGEPGPGTVRELTMARDRLTRELAEARAKHEWYEQILRTREAELKRVRQVNAVLSATVPGRAARTVVSGLRAGRRAVRSVVRRARG
jgi:hypothetical protein